MISGRVLLRDEVEAVWKIDRREVIHRINYFVDSVLILRPDYYAMPGWPLFELASWQAKEWGARKLYISATPSENTVDFYLELGTQVTGEPDPELLRLEPEDIHLVIKLDRHLESTGDRAADP